MEIISLFLTTALVDNICLSKLAGVNESFDNNVSIRKVGTAITISTVVASLLTSIVNQFAITYNGLDFLRIPAFVAICVLIGFLVKNSFGIVLADANYNYLIILNTVVLVACLQTSTLSLMEVIVKSLAYGVGLMLFMYLIKGLDSKINDKVVPAPFRGLPIRLIALAILALCTFAF